MNETNIEVFVDEYGGVDGVGIVLRGASIVEYEDELTPGCKLTARQAMMLAAALARCVQQIENA